MYIDKQDMNNALDINYIKKLLTDSGDLSNEWENRLLAIIQDASSEIDGYLRNRYKLPLTKIPSFLKDICVRIVKYKLMMRKGITKGSAEENIIEDYKLCLKKLEKIASGVISLGIETPTGVEPSVKTMCITEARRFDSNFWKGF